MVSKKKNFFYDIHFKNDDNICLKDFSEFLNEIQNYFVFPNNNNF